MTHCQGCRCDEYRDNPTQPSVSSEWARKQAIQAAAEAVRKVKEARKKPIAPADTEETA